MEELKKKFLLPENWLTLSSNQRLLLFILFGIFLTGLGILFFKKDFLPSSTKIEVLEDTTKSKEALEITAEIAGEVVNPGVYKLSGGSRINDLIVVGGGLSADADRIWVEKYLNRAAKLTDGQKVYIPKAGEQTLGTTAKESGKDQTVSSNFSGRGSGLVNINTASQKELEGLPEIGRARAQNITDHRYYSNVEELLTKGVLKKSVYEKIKDLVTVY